MSRCYYDTIFQRVFCVTLVAIALTFTVILTNVFVDIDGLLSSKDKAQTYDVPVPILESEIHQVKVSNLVKPETVYKEDKYEELNDENYRNKRSLESPNFLFHVKNPKMKNILTNRLATLLEELDEEENLPERQPKEERKTNDRSNAKEELNRNPIEAALKDDADRNDPIENKDEEDMLHLAMHNILLQGIIGHMDLNDVYKKVHSLVRNFKDAENGETPKEKRVPETEKQSEKDTFTSQKEFQFLKTPKEIKRISKVTHRPLLDENQFFEELIKCDKLQNDITNSKHNKNTIGSKEMKLIAQKGPKLLIKTIIDITSSNKDKERKEIHTDSKETIKGIIKLIYNGKSIKFSRVDDEDNQQVKNIYKKPFQRVEVTPKDIDEKPNQETKDIDVTEQVNTIKSNAEHLRNSNDYLNKIIDDYFNKYPKKNDVIDDRFNEDFENKRLKRHIKIKYKDDETTTLSPKPKKINGNDDDELFVEIETHFDSKGLKGDKKKKLIRSIIEKIQKAIHSDIDKFNDGKKRKHKHTQVKKRNQNPLDKDKKLLINKIMLPYDTVEQRHSDPISKAASSQNPLPVVADQSGENWKKSNFGPGFLTMSKSLNSAEMGEVDVDYSKIMSNNGIPQRLQKPLNTDVSEEMLNANTYFDLGNLKFFVKNIDGTGLSIGFNQYTDEAPDPDTMKLFTGIEQLVKTYHHNEHSQGTPANSQDRTRTSMSEERENQISKRDVINDRNEHVLIRRSIKETHENDYHSNEYKIIFDKNFLPYNSYQEIYGDKKRRVALTINKETENINTYNRGSDNVEIIRKNIEIKELPTIIDKTKNLFYKKLKPSEILSIANMLDRKKRSMNLPKITNLKKKFKVNRYLNTRTKDRKKIILNKKRSKRQIDKIRIIARDDISKPRHSEDNIFLINDENLLADRAVIREVETPDVVEEEERIGEQYDMVPVIYEDSPYISHTLDGRSRPIFGHNQLMSKYPHIFMEDIPKSKEDYEPITFSKTRNGIKPGNIHVPDHKNYDVATEHTTTTIDISMPKLDELVSAIDPRQNYKLTVKIIPKNITGDKSGFKEIHASINKSFNKDGLRYSSLVNVSEISKVEDLHKTIETTNADATATTPSPFIKHIQDQQNRMQMLLRQHKTKIDKQLDHLKRERMNLDTISQVKHLHEKVTEKTEVTSTKPNSLLQISNDDVSKFLALFQLHAQNDLTSTAVTSTTTTTAKPTTTQPTEAPKRQLDINENINCKILHQINKNTEMLQTFLQKLTDKLSKEREPVRKNSEEQRLPKYDFIPKYWKPFPEAPEPYQLPSDTKNDTHLPPPLPLVYAYQPPYPMNNFRPPIQQIPIANVVYHGHIHANSLGRYKKNSKPNDSWTDPKTAHDKNQTKYFIDEVEEFKMVPVKKDIKNPSTIEVVPTTTTGKA